MTTVPINHHNRCAFCLGKLDENPNPYKISMFIGDGYKQLHLGCYKYKWPSTAKALADIDLENEWQKIGPNYVQVTPFIRIKRSNI